MLADKRVVLWQSDNELKESRAAEAKATAAPTKSSGSGGEGKSDAAAAAGAAAASAASGEDAKLTLNLVDCIRKFSATRVRHQLCVWLRCRGPASLLLIAFCCALCVARGRCEMTMIPGIA